jgi:hypothetical protein
MPAGPQRPAKNGSRPPKPACAFAPHASGTLSSDREDSRIYFTIFILWGVELACMALLVTKGGGGACLLGPGDRLAVTMKLPLATSAAYSGS